MIDLIDQAFEVVKSKGPNHELIAKLGYELEQSYVRNRQLADENRNIRRSYSRLKRWFTRQFKYYKAHRDELIRQKENRLDGAIQYFPKEKCEKESGFRLGKRSSSLVSEKYETTLVFNSDKEQNSGDTRCAGGT